MMIEIQNNNAGQEDHKKWRYYPTRHSLETVAVQTDTPRCKEMCPNELDKKLLSFNPTITLFDMIFSLKKQDKNYTIKPIYPLNKNE
jgi:hypothetical protein